MTRKLRPDWKILKGIFKTSFKLGAEENIRLVYYLEVGKGSKKIAVLLKDIVLGKVIDCFLLSWLAPVAKEEEPEFSTSEVPNLIHIGPKIFSSIFIHLLSSSCSGVSFFPACKMLCALRNWYSVVYLERHNTVNCNINNADDTE